MRKLLLPSLLALSLSVGTFTSPAQALIVENDLSPDKQPVPELQYQFQNDFMRRMAEVEAKSGDQKFYIYAFAAPKLDPKLNIGELQPAEYAALAKTNDLVGKGQIDPKTTTVIVWMRYEGDPQHGGFAAVPSTTYRDHGVNRNFMAGDSTTTGEIPKIIKLHMPNDPASAFVGIADRFQDHYEMMRALYNFGYVFAQFLCVAISVGGVIFVVYKIRDGIAYRAYQAQQAAEAIVLNRRRATKALQRLATYYNDDRDYADSISACKQPMLDALGMYFPTEAVFSDLSVKRTQMIGSYITDRNSIWAYLNIQLNLENEGDELMVSESVADVVKDNDINHRIANNETMRRAIANFDLAVVAEWEALLLIKDHGQVGLARFIPEIEDDTNPFTGEDAPNSYVGLGHEGYVQGIRGIDPDKITIAQYRDIRGRQARINELVDDRRRRLDDITIAYNDVLHVTDKIEQWQPMTPPVTVTPRWMQLESELHDLQRNCRGYWDPNAASALYQTGQIQECFILIQRVQSRLNQAFYGRIEEMKSIIQSEQKALNEAARQAQVAARRVANNSTYGSSRNTTVVIINNSDDSYRSNNNNDSYGGSSYSSNDAVGGASYSSNDAVGGGEY